MNAEFVKSVFSVDDVPHERLPEIAVAGKSNVGKSTLLNKLTGKHGLAKTSQTPGKTQCLNYYRVEPARLSAFFLVDLPGYGYAKVSQATRDQWAKLIDGYLVLPDRPSGLIALFDSRREPADVDLDWIAWLGAWGRPVVIALTKGDKLSRNEQAQSIRRWTIDDLGVQEVIMSSATEGLGIDKLWGWIDEVRSGQLKAV